MTGTMSIRNECILPGMRTHKPLLETKKNWSVNSFLLALSYSDKLNQGLERLQETQQGRNISKTVRASLDPMTITG